MVSPDWGDAIGYFQEIWLQKKYTKYYTPKNGDCVMDIGAAIGEFSIFAALCGKNVKVYCYEPDNRCFGRLKRNIQLNSLASRVFPLNLAVSGKEGELEIFDGGNDYMEDRKYLTRATTLEKIFRDNKIERCDFLKIDIEGAEYDVLKSAPRSLFKIINHIVVEYHDGLQGLDDLLKEAGYEIHTMASINEVGYLYADRTA